MKVVVVLPYSWRKELQYILKTDAYASEGIINHQTSIPFNDRSHAVAHSRAHFGQGVGPVVYDNLGCMGTEADLSECRHTPFGHSDCKHDEDAGVTCGRVIS